MKLEIATSIVDWFDVNDTNHVGAYRHLQQTGVWERGFLPENIIFPVAWHAMIAFKLADAYMDEKLKHNIKEVGE